MTFSKIIKEIKRNSQEIKIVVVGLDNAGKTTIINSLFNKSIDNVSPTFGYSINLYNYKDVLIQVLDIGGQSLFREYWDSYFDKADGIIFVYDLSLDKEISQKYLKEIINNSDIPILILGNKVDLINQNAESLFVDSRIFKLKCSGLKKINLEKGMDWLVGECKKRSF
ncbi:ADP-ribosylation factor-like protein 2 [Nosema bombycis CQ1]|uniref:ADP-ribosylation factor-like protein 2 n=1 Tax=Nosema bombycis (strain CQ1 / CVCC 102059) TaxID=578461 RepID=R0MKK8_NOSB1|nr:ADP-ribosylation factor-like protein 2 [Nosema bombycis CQ1]|eukprot:EOB14775.1 ADP-ribosylation factor-like protein 2 [Nosema bombycis CQ1]